MTLAEPRNPRHPADNVPKGVNDWAPPKKLIVDSELPLRWAAVFLYALSVISVQ